jgi:hypothetical protein
MKLKFIVLLGFLVSFTFTGCSASYEDKLPESNVSSTSEVSKVELPSILELQQELNKERVEQEVLPEIEQSFDSQIEESIANLFKLRPIDKVDPTWKSKIIGKPQKTGTPGHVSTSMRVAVLCAQMPEVRLVFLDQWLKTITRGKVAKEVERRRPDVAVELKTGEIWQFEVRSKTDSTRELRARMIQNKEGMPLEMQGGERVILIRNYKYGNKTPRRRE